MQAFGGDLQPPNDFTRRRPVALMTPRLLLFLAFLLLSLLVSQPKVLVSLWRCDTIGLYPSLFWLGRYREITLVKMADNTPKAEMAQKEVVHDHDVLGDGNVTREEAMHYGVLTEEEKMHEKKLLRKIDSLIMPLVMLVSRR